MQDFVFYAVSGLAVGLLMSLRWHISRPVVLLIWVLSLIPGWFITIGAQQQAQQVLAESVTLSMTGTVSDYAPGNSVYSFRLAGKNFRVLKNSRCDPGVTIANGYRVEVVYAFNEQENTDCIQSLRVIATPEISRP
ncbi:MAG: hypothetical protein CMI02_01340 [Oceanospirillaceae bacterium]|nr:hypothetical protein [Oceanospirillaceae bacterium]MBT10663.1 hypothetical protein [Oceanospirillaceae bacterium]